MPRFEAVVAVFLMIFTRFSPSLGVRQVLIDEETSLSVIDATLDTCWSTDFLKDGLKDVMDSVTNNLKDIVDNIKDVKEDVLDTVDDLKDQMNDKLKDLKDTVDNIKDDGLDTVDDLKDQMNDKLKDLKDTVDKIKDDGLDTVDALKDQMKDKVKDLKDTVDNIKDDGLATVDDLKNQMKDKLKDLKDTVNNVKDGGLDTVDDLKAQMKDKLKDLKDTVDNIKDDVLDTVDGLKDEIKDNVDAAISNFVSTVDKLKSEASLQQQQLAEKMESLQTQMKTGTTDTRAWLDAQFEEAKAKFQETKQKFADDLIGENVAMAANIIRKEMQELQRKLKYAQAQAQTVKDGTTKMLKNQIKENKERLQRMRDAATTKGVELAATIDQARVILTERIGELTVRAKRAKADVQKKIDSEIVSLKTQLQELREAAKTKVDGVGRGIQSIRDIIDSKIGYLAEKVKTAQGEAKNDINAQILELRAQGEEIYERAVAKRADIENVLKDAKAELEDNLGDKFDQMVGKLKTLSASAAEIVNKKLKDPIDALKKRIDTFQQGSAETMAALQERKELLESIVADTVGDASVKLEAAVTKISESVGELRKKLKVASEEKKAELQAGLDKLQEQGKELRDAADSMRDSAQEKAAAIAQTISEKIGELREKLKDAQQDTQTQIQSEILNLRRMRKDFMLKVGEKREDIRKSLQSGTSTVAETIGALKIRMANAAKEKKVEIEASINSFKAQILSIRAELGGKLAEAEVKVSEVGELISENIGELTMKLEAAIAGAQGSTSEAIRTRITALRGNVALLIERSLPNDVLFANFKERMTKAIHDATESLKTAAVDKKKMAQDVLQKLKSRLEQVTNTLSHDDVPDASLLQKLESRLDQVTNAVSSEDVPDVFAAVMHADNVVEASIKELENDDQKEALAAKQDEMWEALPYAAMVSPSTPDDDGKTEVKPPPSTPDDEGTTEAKQAKSASMAMEPKYVLVVLTVLSVVLQI